MHTREKFFIGDRWVSPLQPGRMQVRSPRNGHVIGSVPRGNAQDIDAAVMAASRGLETWKVLRPDERAAFLERIADVLAQDAVQLAELLSEEVGMPLKLARRIQVDLPIENLRNHARLLRKFPFSERVGNSLVLREPVGVVAAITPWNYPLHQIVLKVAGALAAGCTVVLKPSEVTPLNAFRLADAVHVAALPAGVFNLVTGAGADLGQALAHHSRVDKISFTGSTAVGKLVAAEAAGSLKRVTLELGGKSAAVLLDDADLHAAVRHTVNACCLNTGQTCTALTRMLVPASQYVHICELVIAHVQKLKVGDPFDPTSRMGPLVTESQRNRVREYINTGIEEGATLLAGGAMPPHGVDPGGWYVQPTVFGDVRHEMTIAREEIFGPVLAILTYDDEEHAVRIANGLPFGLAASVWGTPQRAAAIAHRLRAGQVDVNGGAFNISAPFGGFKQSGYGREAGVYGIEDNLEYKSIQFNDAPSTAGHLQSV